MGHEYQLGFLTFSLAQQPGLQVRGALMGGIATPFSMEVHRGIALVIACRLGWVTVPGFEALQAGGRLNQCSVHGEVLVRQQAPPVRLQYHFVEQGLAHPMLQEPLPVLGEGGGIKAGLNQVHPQKPAEEEVVV